MLPINYVMTLSSGTLMTAAAMNPWFAGALATGPNVPTEKRSSSPNRTQDKTSQEGPDGREGEPVAMPVASKQQQQQQQPQAVAIFQSHKSATGEGHYVDYSR